MKVTTNTSYASKIIKSSLWQYIGSWIDKLIGFIATIILARILLPEDFGVIATVSIVTGFFHVLSSVGTPQYLLRKESINNSDLNTAWTINVIMKSISAISIFLLAEVIADFIEDYRLVSVLQVISIVPFITGFNNIGMIFYEKEYNYKPRFINRLTSRIIGFLVKIYLALTFQSYWAFIIAEVIETLALLTGSYILHKVRPKFSLTNFKEQWGFSQWILLKSIFVFIRFRVDNIFLSKYLPLEELGVYTVAKDVATLPSGQIIGPVMDPLYVGLSAIHKDPVLLADKVHKTLSVMFAIVLPISLGTYITADNLVAVLLGSQWGHAVPIVMILALTLLPVMLSDFFTRVMTALGKVKLIFKFELLLGLFTIITFAYFASGMDLIQFAELRVVITAVNTLFVLLILTLKSKISFFRIVALIILPLLSSILMVFFIISINIFIEQYTYLVELCIQITAGALFYLIFISLCIYVLRNTAKEYQFIWKTFYLQLFHNFKNKKSF